MLAISRNLLLAAALTMPIYGEQPTINGKPDLSGSWRLEKKNDTLATSKAVIEQNAEQIRIRELSDSGETPTEVKCGVKGKECAARVDGAEAQVAIWYNGPTLVQMTTKGTTVVKTHRTLSADGQKMTLEIIPIAPDGKNETLTFVRSDATEQKSAQATK